MKLFQYAIKKRRNIHLTFSEDQLIIKTVLSIHTDVQKYLP